MIIDSHVRLEILTKEKYESNKYYYNNSIGKIASSICFLDYNLDRIYELYSIHSVALLIKDDIIVSFMTAMPHAEYSENLDCYVNEDKSFWHIDLIETHDDYQKRGYAKRVILYGMKDMISKGANKFDGVFNSGSKSLIEQIANELGFSIQYKNARELILSNHNKAANIEDLNKCCNICNGSAEIVKKTF